MTRLLILGASGQVGQHVLQLALQDSRISAVCAPSRRPLAPHSKLENPIVDFNQLPASAAWWQADIVICALGTTMKLAGSKEAFYQVDHDYVLACAQHAKQAGARCFVLNSSTGAKQKASSYYLRVKAKIERDVGELGFARYCIVRPSLLISENRPDRRPGEEMGIRLGKLFSPLLPKRIRPVECLKVASKMLEVSLVQAAGRVVVESEEIV